MAFIHVTLIDISVLRDMKEFGRDLDQILRQYTTYVKPAFEEFCLPVCTQLYSTFCL